jgi:hypothetical protein
MNTKIKFIEKSRKALCCFSSIFQDFKQFFNYIHNMSRRRRDSSDEEDGNII